jgi:hypothetical protein
VAVEIDEINRGILRSGEFAAAHLMYLVGDLLALASTPG